MKLVASVICICAALLSGCSSVILSYGLTEGKIFGSQGYPAYRDHVIKKLGEPTRTFALAPHIHLSEIHWNTGPELPPANWYRNHRRERFALPIIDRGPDGKGRVKEMRPDPELTRWDEFSVKGRIPPGSYAPSSTDLTLATAGVAELVSVPTAIAYRSGGKHTVNHFWVWYDKKDQVAAYEWEFE